MNTMRTAVGVLSVATAIVLASHATLARVDVRVEHDKTIDFRPLHTWAWHADGAGAVRMARTQNDDPEAMKASAEPLILAAVASEMTRHGLQQAAAQPDLTVKYYLLLTTNLTAQTVGQFLPATTAW